jgi:gluconolactonase
MMIRQSPEFDKIVSEDAEIEHLVKDLLFTEGPVWHPDGYLLLSDIRGNTIYRWDDHGGLRVWRRPSSMANGLTYDSQLRLLACEHATSRVTRSDADGGIEVVASHYGEKELNSPNDLVVKTDGGIYFTDPLAGRMADFGVEREAELDFCGVYRVEPDSNDLVLLAGDFETPNGLCFSPDETLLYVNDSMRMHIRVFDVLGDGTLANDRLFFTEPGSIEDGCPDGMKVDEVGNIYCMGPGGIWVMSPEGEHLGTLELPEFGTNLTWGGPDWRTLYVTAGRSLYRIQMNARGAPGVYTHRNR